jgi:hypothetical protein
MLPDSNYLFAEEAIIARLQAAVPGVHVGAIGSSDELSSAHRRFPGLYVIYAGDVVSAQGAGRGAASQAEQHWIVAAAVKDAGTLHTGEAARKECGVLFCALLHALQGFEAAPGMTLVRTDTALPVLYESGHIFLAAEFTLTVDIVGGN